MKDIEQLASTLHHIGEHVETVKSLQQKVGQLEKAIQEHVNKSNEGWMTLAKAADEVGLTSSALRQKAKNKDKPLPEGKVWKQEYPKAAIYINLKELGAYI
jgi:DNA anti-recombination protein RmuC